MTYLFVLAQAQGGGLTDFFDWLTDWGQTTILKVFGIVVVAICLMALVARKSLAAMIGLAVVVIIAAVLALGWKSFATKAQKDVDNHDGSMPAAVEVMSPLTT